MVTAAAVAEAIPLVAGLCLEHDDVDLDVIACKSASSRRRRTGRRSES